MTQKGGELRITDHKTKKVQDEDDFKQLPRRPKGGLHALSAFEMIQHMVKQVPVPKHLTPDICPLFCHPNGRAFDYRDALREVKRIADLLPGGPKMYGAHSLRIGGATAAAKCKSVDSLALQIMGVWSGEKSMTLYTRRTKKRSRKIARQIAKKSKLELQAGSMRQSQPRHHQSRRARPYKYKHQHQFG